MNEAIALRKELRGYIDSIPERHLPALKPLLADLAGTGTDYWTSVIEPANAEEAAMIEERMKDYYADPSSFISLETIG
jgi:hypothetical protein